MSNKIKVYRLIFWVKVKDDIYQNYKDISIIRILFSNTGLLFQEQELNRLKKELALNKTLAAAATALPTT